VPAKGDPRGYYRALGVPRTASAEEIRVAFRERAMASHPDRAGETADGETFRLIRDAYDVLRDPQRRMAYDAAAADEPVTTAAREPTVESGREQRAGRNGVAAPSARQKLDRLLPLAAAGLVVALVVATGSLWSAHRQLADQETVLAELYARLARLGEDQADLRTRYRSLAFLDLERAVGRRAVPGGTSAATAYLHEIAFPAGALDLVADQTNGLAQALIDIAGLVEALPPDADWLLVLEVQAARAAEAGQVAVDAWETALLRLATVLDHLLGQGLPAERIAIRFNAGFAPAGIEQSSSAFDRVLIKLVCCAE